MNKTVNLRQIKRIAKKLSLEDGYKKNIVKITSKPDFVERTLLTANVLSKILNDYVTEYKLVVTLKDKFLL